MDNKKALKLKLEHNQKGQTLLFVVVAMTIALSIGINASVRTITSLSRTTRTDTAARALAAAEGGIERFIALPTQDLEDAVEVTEGTSVDCPVGDRRELPMHHGGGSYTYDNYCMVSFSGSGDILTSQAFVTVERYIPTFYPFSLESGQVKEINLYDFNTGAFYAGTDDEIEICWTSRSESDIMYISYNSTGVQARGGLTGNDSPPNPYHQEGFVTALAGHDDYTNCEKVDISNNIYGLRIRSVGGDSDVGVFGVGDSLPLQGYRITSLGKLEQDQGVVATRIISIIRTLPYLPVSFDYALYSEAPIFK